MRLPEAFFAYREDYFRYQAIDTPHVSIRPEMPFQAGYRFPHAGAISGGDTHFSRSPAFLFRDFFGIFLLPRRGLNFEGSALAPTAFNGGHFTRTYPLLTGSEFFGAHYWRVVCWVGDLRRYGQLVLRYFIV